MGRIKHPKKVIKTSCAVETQEGSIPFELSRSTGRRTLSITIDERAKVSVASPFHMKDSVIHEFIHEKAGWIVAKVHEAQKVKNLLKAKVFEHGQKFLFLGKKYLICTQEQPVKRGRIIFDVLNGWSVILPPGLDRNERQMHIKRMMLRWYRDQATEILGGRIFHYSRLMKVEPKIIAVRTQKRLWGCCDYNTQTIHMNWQIILSPIKVIDYVVIHELCHLTVPNHSKRFWNKVEKFMPDYKVYKRWLKENHLDMVLP